MCGIAGYVGGTKSVDIALEGLKRLEYRGYDSAGISFADPVGQLQFYKKRGHIGNLINLLSGVPLNSHCAIGHTRWATHGEVSDQNAHPHVVDALSLVHNGIIENADYLRTRLQAQGFKFKSATDSEVFLALIWTLQKQGLNIQEAIFEACLQVKGQSAFVVMNSATGEIFAIKRGVSLVCYVKNDREVGIASDLHAFDQHACQVYIPPDNTLCLLSSSRSKPLYFYSAPDKEIDTCEFHFTRKVAIKRNEGKGDFEHYMLKEIHEQPDLIEPLIQYYLDGEGRELLERLANVRSKYIVIVACGTAYYAGMILRYILERLNRIPVHLELSSEFRYTDPILSPDTVGILISQSGETADTLSAQDLLLKNNISTIGIVNVEGSTLFLNNTFNLLINAGVEVGVASTKAFSQMVLTGRLLAHAWSSVDERSVLRERYALLAKRIKELLSASEMIKEIAQKIYTYRGFIYTGRNIYYPVALEGALKLKEIAYVHAEGHAAGELKHGPIALIDRDMANIAIIGPQLRDKAVANMREIKAREGAVVGLVSQYDKVLCDICDYFIPLNYDGLEELAPVYVNVANQLLAYYIAQLKGTDIDRPRNLAKSVTVE